MTFEFKLLINADDYGLTEGVSRGIACLLSAGKISNTTAMMCSEFSLEVQNKLRPVIDSSRIGVHLQLTAGVPLTNREGSTLLDRETGTFRSKTEFGELDPADVYTEWAAQVELYKRFYGHLPSHIDTHHGPHRQNHLLPVYAEIARTYRVPARGGPPAITAVLKEHGIEHCEVLFDTWTGTGATAEDFLRGVAALARQHKAACIEAESHPGFADRSLQSKSSLSTGRAHEMIELYSIDKDDFRKIGATLVHYAARKA